MKKIIKIITVFILFSACNNNEILYDKVKELPSPDDSEYLITTGLIKESKFLELKTPKEVIIGEVYQIVITKDRILISDFNQTKSVFLFDNKGNFIKHITGNSKGPKEFIQPTYISADYLNNIFYVLDDKSAKVNTYDVNGSFIEKISFEFISIGCQKINENLFAFQGGFSSIDNKEKYEVLYANKDGKVIKRFLKPEKWRKNSKYQKRFNFSENLGKIYYSPVYSEYIYSLEQNVLTPEYHINLGNKFITKDNSNKIDLANGYNGYIHAIEHFIKADNHIYYNYITLNKEKRSVTNHVFGNISTNKGVYRIDCVNAN